MTTQAKSYRVTVNRIPFQQATFDVQAGNQLEAKNKAIEQACNHVFNEKDAEYAIEDVSVMGKNIYRLFLSDQTDSGDVVEFECEAPNFLEAQNIAREQVAHDSNIDSSDVYIFGNTKGDMASIETLAKQSIFIDKTKEGWRIVDEDGELLTFDGKSLESNDYDDLVKKATTLMHDNMSEEFENDAYDYLMSRVEYGDLSPEDLCRMIVNAGTMTPEEWRKDMRNKMDFMDEEPFFSM